MFVSLCLFAARLMQIAYSPLYLASARGHVEVVRRLLAAGAKPEKTLGQVRSSPRSLHPTFAPACISVRSLVAKS